MTNVTVAHVERVLTDAESLSATSALAASWRRSLMKHRLDPALRLRRARIDHARLNQRLQGSEMLLRAAIKRLDGLYGMVAASGCGVFLTDAEGVILETRCTGADADLFEKCDLWRGADWSEAVEGTNGIGTCLAEQRPVVIHRDEHFFACHISMSCIDAPIFYPNGQLAGALDVSTARLDHDPRFNDLIGASVLQAARQIETEMFRTSFSRDRILMADTSGNDVSALYAVDDDDLVVGATRAARRLSSLPASGPFDAIPYADLENGQGDKGGPRGFDRGERAAIMRALSRSKGNVSAAAKQLGVGRATLYRRMRRLEVS